MMRKSEETFEVHVRSMDLGSTLARAQMALDSHMANRTVLGQRLQTVRARLLEERLQLAVLGQFKRGKSTFINALLGAAILPTGVVPLTAIAVFIAWGAEPLARVLFKTDRPAKEFRSTYPQALQDFLARFVAEEQNQKNRLAVARVELFYPAPILTNGTVLIDTPGVGSTHQHNTEAAIQVLPECDAALFIVSADPPITEIELAYLQRIKGKMARLFFVLNKLDYLDDREQCVAIDFLRKVLSERILIKPSAPIFGVSARNGLTAKQANNDDALEKSGISKMEDHLLRYLATEKTRSLEQAVRRKAADILSEAIVEAELRRQALIMPIEALTGKASAFQESLRSIEQQRLVTRDLLTGDKRRLVNHLENRVQALREDSSSQLAAVVDERLASDDPGTWEQKAQNAVAEAIQGLFEVARQHLMGEFAEEVTKVLTAHQQRFNDLATSVRRTAAELFDVTLGPQYEREAFELGEDPYWVTEEINVRLLPDPGRVVDRLIPLNVRRSRMRARIMQQVNDLIVRNAENLRWAILRGLDDTILQAAGQLEERLDEAMAATKGVIEDAQARRRDRSAVIEDETAKLGRFIAELTAISKSLASERIDAEEDRDEHPILEPVAWVK